MRRAFVSAKDSDKPHTISLVNQLLTLGFEIISTKGTAEFLAQHDIPCHSVFKVNEGRPHIVDMIKNGDVDFIVNTTEGRQAIADSIEIRCQAVQSKVPYTTTIAGAKATCLALAQQGDITVNSLQQLHQELVYE